MSPVLVLCLVCVVLLLCMLLYDLLRSRRPLEEKFKEIKRYSEFIYYIPFIDNDFALALKDLMIKNQHLEIASVASNNRGMYGSTSGFYVVFRKKEPQ